MLKPTSKADSKPIHRGKILCRSKGENALGKSEGLCSVGSILEQRPYLRGAQPTAMVCALFLVFVSGAVEVAAVAVQDIIIIIICCKSRPPAELQVIYP